MAAWADPPIKIKPKRVTRKRPPSHLRNLANDLQVIARETAQKGA